MNLELIAFTAKGRELADKLTYELIQQGQTAACTREAGMRVEDWAARAFSRSQGLIFIGAAGIAVRAIAPHLRHKSQDPAVVVIDELGQFVIPLLSGHLGGANDLACTIAQLLGAQPVLTTATDVRGVFAVDQWARRQGLVVCNPKQILAISSALLDGKTVGIWSRWPIEGTLPHGLFWTEPDSAGVVLDWYLPKQEALWLCPKTIRAGIGCRRGTTVQAIAALVDQVFQHKGLCPDALCGVYTIDRKGDEPGLLDFCAQQNLPLTTYTPFELQAIPGNFPSSSFVSQTVGVDNVCQRAALAEGGILLQEKTSLAGVTLALAAEPPHLDWRNKH